MLHILLTIFKIIGIILLSILGLILLILACLLFVPIRYNAKIKKDEELLVKANVSYLLHAISITTFFDGKNKGIKFKLFGINLKKKNKSQKSSKKKKRRSIKKSKENTKNQKINNFDDDFEYEIGSELENNIENTNNPESTNNPKDYQNLENKEKNENKEKHDSNESKESKEGIISKITSLKEKIVYQIKGICGKIKKAFKSATDLKNFLQERSTKEAFTFIRGELFKILMYVKPRKIKGYIVYGFEDPSLTGKVLGGYYIITKGRFSKFKVCPDFENKRLETDVYIRGRIRIYYILLIALKIYRNKNFMSVIGKRRKNG